MACIEKIILAFVIVQVSAVALAKPHKPGIDDGLYRSNDDIKGFIYKREPADCGTGCTAEGCFQALCRPSSGCTKLGEYHTPMYDNKCPGEEKCCLCHERNNCALEF